MYKQTNTLKKIIVFLFLCLIFVFGFSWRFYKVSPVEIFSYFRAQIGTTVGMSVGVAENPFNTLAKQLKEKELRLKEKEELLNAKEIELEEKKFSRAGEVILAIILAIIIIQFILILLNFYLDYKNRKRNTYGGMKEQCEKSN